MGQSLASLQAKIQTKIFNDIAGTGTISRVTWSPDKYGDSTSTLASSTTTTVVPFNLIVTEDFQPFGDLQAGEMDIILPYDTSFDTNDFIDYKGVRYIIKEYEEYPFKGGTLALAVRVAKQL